MAATQSYHQGQGHPSSMYIEDDSDAASARHSRVVSQPAPLLDQCECAELAQSSRCPLLELTATNPPAHLRPGKQAALLSHDRTLELYRENAKKTNDPELIFEFAVFMIDAAKSMVVPDANDPAANPAQPRGSTTAAADKKEEITKEATTLLKKLADRGHPDAQYFLADCYANGIGTVRGRQDFDRAFPLFVLAAKHGHPDACYRAGTCCEHGWGCRRESAKAIQFYK